MPIFVGGTFFQKITKEIQGWGDVFSMATKTPTTADLRIKYRGYLQASGMTPAAFKTACVKWLWARASDNEDTLEGMGPEEFTAAAYWLTRAA